MPLTRTFIAAPSTAPYFTCVENPSCSEVNVWEVRGSQHRADPFGGFAHRAPGDGDASYIFFSLKKLDPPDDMVVQAVREVVQHGISSPAISNRDIE